MDLVEIVHLVPATSTHDALKADLLIMPQCQRQQPELSTLSDDDSDVEGEVFSDAPEYMLTDLAVPVSHVTIRSCVVNEAKPMWKWISHNINTVLLTIGMLAGLTFAYLQWRQQARSNQMSFIQTCLAMEQAATSTSNSSLCQSTLQKGIRRARSVSLEEPTESLLEPLTPSSAIQHDLLHCGLVLIGGAVAIFIFIISRDVVSRAKSCLGSVTTAEHDQTEPIVHVPIHVPRLTSTSFEHLGVDNLKRRVTSVPNDENEHLYYLEAQATLAQEMRVRTLSWRAAETSDQDGSTPEWQDIDMPRSRWHDDPDVKVVPWDGTMTRRSTMLSHDTDSDSEQDDELTDQTDQTHNSRPRRSERLDGIKHDSDRRWRHYQSRVLLSRALAQANRALFLDRRLKRKPAIEAYNKTCEILQQAITQTAHIGDRGKLSAIKAAYSARATKLLKSPPKSNPEFVTPEDWTNPNTWTAEIGKKHTVEDYWAVLLSDPPRKQSKSWQRRAREPEDGEMKTPQETLAGSEGILIEKYWWVERQG